MKAAATPLLLVPFREVRHEQPDDCLHYEPVAVRGRLHDWTIPAHRHEGLHQFQLLEKGCANATIDGVAYQVSAPAILMLAPGSVHAFAYTADSAGHQLTLPAATLKAALAGASQLEAELRQSFVMDAAALGADATACAAMFEALAREFLGSAAGRAQSLMAHATLIAVWFLRHRGTQPLDGRRVASRDTLVQRLRALVEQHYREHRPVAFYAAALQVTPDHLSRACRAVTGQSALDLLHARLMLEARRLLSYTPATVADIAGQLGYEDSGYFSKFFARSVGDSPTAYRESVHSGVRMMERQPQP